MSTNYMESTTYVSNVAGAPSFDYRLPLMCSHVQLQRCLRSFCTDSQHSSSSSWLYAVFWRILPRNFPPPKWESASGYLGRTKANKRNWILVWEDGYCDFGRATSSVGLQPDLFFKMSHEVYNYGEGLMGKVAADSGHKWVHSHWPSAAHQPVESTPPSLSNWQNSIDPQPRTWEPQFKSGIQTIAVIAVREGLVQLGSTHKIQEDQSFVTLLQSKFDTLLLTLCNSSPPPSLMAPATAPMLMMRDKQSKQPEVVNEPATISTSERNGLQRQRSWNGSLTLISPNFTSITNSHGNNNSGHPVGSSTSITPSMSSLQALLSKLPAVTSPTGTKIIDHVNVPRSSNSNGTRRGTINSNGSLPFNYCVNLHDASADLIRRSLSAPLAAGHLWLHDHIQPSLLTQQQPQHSPTFVSLDPNITGGDYSLMGDLLGN